MPSLCMTYMPRPTILRDFSGENTSLGIAKAMLLMLVDILALLGIFLDTDYDM